MNGALASASDSGSSLAVISIQPRGTIVETEWREEGINTFHKGDDDDWGKQKLGTGWARDYRIPLSLSHTVELCTLQRAHADKQRQTPEHLCCLFTSRGPLVPHSQWARFKWTPRLLVWRGATCSQRHAEGRSGIASARRRPTYFNNRTDSIFTFRRITWLEHKPRQ